MRLTVLVLLSLALLLSKSADAATQVLTHRITDRMGLSATDNTQDGIGATERVQRTYTFDAFDPSLGQLQSVHLSSQLRVSFASQLEDEAYLSPGLPTVFQRGNAQFNASSNAVLRASNALLALTNGQEVLACDTLINAVAPDCPVDRESFLRRSIRSSSQNAANWGLSHGFGEVNIDFTFDVTADLVTGRSAVTTGFAATTFELRYTYEAAPAPVPLPAGLPLYLGVLAAVWRLVGVRHHRL